MYVGRPRKILRTIYLYMAIPLLLLTAVLAMTSLMHHRRHKGAEPAEVKPDQPVWSIPLSEGSGSLAIPASSGSGHGTGTGFGAGAGAGSSEPWLQYPPPAARLPPADKDAAGEAAIITAIATGIAGLLGAVTQVVLVFLKLKERRPKDDQS